MASVSSRPKCVNSSAAEGRILPTLKGNMAYCWCPGRLRMQWHYFIKCWGSVFHMMTSSNGNIFRVTGPLCGEFTGPGEFPAQRPVMRSFDVFFDLRLNKRLSKQRWGWWFETPAWSLWRHRNDEEQCQQPAQSQRWVTIEKHIYVTCLSF